MSDRAGRALVLVSGGLDSAVTLAIAASECADLYALTLRYGQRHGIEVDCARRIAAAAGVREHRILDLDLSSWGGSSLTGEGSVPKGEAADRRGAIPSTYVPARNTILLSLGLAWAEVLGAEAVYIGVHRQDAGGYPDTRPEFLRAFEQVVRFATRAGVEGRAIAIRAPLVRMTKAEVIREGDRRGVDFSLASSCYDPRSDGEPCGSCDACRLRASGFLEAGLPDPRTGGTRR